jgi:uncharacterized protein
MAYFDTSVLLPYYCPEALSGKSEGLISGDDEPSISPLTGVEFASAISRKVREKTLRLPDAQKIWNLFETHRRLGYYIERPVEARHFDLAASFLTRFRTPLRTLDALHLAIAALLTARLVTADAVLAKSGTLLGIDVLLVK